MPGIIRKSLLLCAAAGLAGTLACKPPTDEGQEQMQTDVETLKADQLTLQKTMKDNLDAIDQIKQRVDRMEAMLKTSGAGGGASAAQMQQITTQLQSLEARVAQIKSAPQPSGRSARPVAAEEGTEAAAGAVGTTQPSMGGSTTTTEAPAGEARTNRPSGQASKTPSVSGRRNRTTSNEPTPVAGTWYTSKAGDTFESIASTHGTTASAIRKANNLPASSKAIPNNSDFIPKQ